MELFRGSLRVVHAGVEIVCGAEAQRVLETSHPPTYYLPVDAFTEAGRSAMRPSASRASQEPARAERWDAPKGSVGDGSGMHTSPGFGRLCQSTAV